MIAILLAEPDRLKMVEAMARAPNNRMSAATRVESAIKIDGQGSPRLSEGLDELVRTLRVEIVPVSVEHATAARRAYQLYGKGNHPARLNYGDCFSYALAKTSGEPLLFKGNDFSQTDIEPALKY